MEHVSCDNLEVPTVNARALQSRALQLFIVKICIHCHVACQVSQLCSPHEWNKFFSFLL